MRVLFGLLAELLKTEVHDLFGADFDSKLAACIEHKQEPAKIRKIR
jgi:hypothetical protein